MLRGGYALEGNHVCKLGVVHDNADALGGILRGTAADGDHIIGSGLAEGLHPGLHHGHARIGLHLVKNLIGEISRVQQVGHFFDRLEPDQVGVGYNQGLLEASGFYLGDDLTDGSGTVIASFVQNKTVCHKKIYPFLFVTR